MKVLHVTETFPGGVSTYLHTLIAEQLRSFDVSGVSLLLPHEYLPLVSLCDPKFKVRSYVRGRGRFSSLWTLLTAYRRSIAAIDPDIIHIHSTYAGIVCRFPVTRVPRVYCPHGWAFDREDAHLAVTMYKAIEKTFQFGCERIIAISDFEQQSAIAAGIKNSRMKVIRHGIPDIAVESQPIRDVKQTGPVKLLFVGRPARQKGLDWLLDVMAGLPATVVELFVVGATADDVGPVQALHQDNVHFLGWLSEQKILSMFEKVDALIVPSRWEGFGLVAIEAMRSGIPVLASQRGALPEVVGAQSNLLFEFGDTDGLRRLLRSLSKQQLAKAGTVARKRYLEKFQSSGMTGATIKLYAELIASAARSKGRAPSLEEK